MHCQYNNWLLHAHVLLDDSFWVGLLLSFESPVALFSTPLATCYFVGELYQQQAVSPIASRENQVFSAVTGVKGYSP